MNDDLKPIWLAVKAAGGACYYYGDTLRDYLLKRPIPELHVALYHMPLYLLDPILKDMEFEYILFPGRIELSHGQTMYMISEMSDRLEAHTNLSDPFDFTIDSIYCDCATDVVYDPHGGVSDIKNKLLKIDKNGLLDQPIRMIQAARLSAELGFTLSVETWFSIYELAIGIKHVSPQEIRLELDKILRLSKPSIAFKLLQSTRILEYLLPELAACETIIQNKRAGVHNVFDHTMYALDAAHPDPAIKMTMLFHDIAKPQTIEYSDDGKIHFFRHDVVGARIAKTYLKAWGYDKDFINKVSTLITHHMFDAAPNITDKAVRRLIKKVGKEHIYDLLLVREADRLGSPEKISMKKVRSIRKKIDKEIVNL